MQTRFTALSQSKSPVSQSTQSHHAAFRTDLSARPLSPLRSSSSHCAVQDNRQPEPDLGESSTDVALDFLSGKPKPSAGAVGGTVREEKKSERFDLTASQEDNLEGDYDDGPAPRMPPPSQPPAKTAASSGATGQRAGASQSNSGSDDDSPPGLPGLDSDDDVKPKRGTGGIGSMGGIDRDDSSDGKDKGDTAKSLGFDADGDAAGNGNGNDEMDDFFGGAFGSGSQRNTGTEGRAGGRRNRRNLGASKAKSTAGGDDMLGKLVGKVTDD